MPDIGSIGYADIDGVGSSPITITTTTAVPAGARVVVVVGNDIRATVPSVSGGGLTWETDSDVSAGDDRLTFLAANAPDGLPAGTALTVSYSGNALPRMAQALYIGNVTGSPVNATAQANDNGPEWSVPITTTVDKAVILAVGMNQWNAEVESTAEGYVTLASLAPGPVAEAALIVLDRATTQAGTYEPGGVWTASEPWTAVAVAYALRTPVRGTPFPWTWATGVRSLRDDLYTRLALPASVGGELGIVDPQVAALMRGDVVTFSTAQLRSFYPTGTEHPSLPANLGASDAWDLSGDDELLPAS